MSHPPTRRVDDRVRRVIDDVVRRKHRALFFIVGDRAKDQVVNLHRMLACARHQATLEVLWCMKAEPDFGSTGKKRQERRARLEVKGGLSTEASKEAFQTFLSHTPIRFCPYKETHKILGQTFDVAVLQDFEALTPNTLARTVETVRGGGVVMVMLRGLSSLTQLYLTTMDVHARYRTDALRTVVPRFNERLIRSLADCATVLCVDDDLRVLPITQSMWTPGAAAEPPARPDETDGGTDGVPRERAAQLAAVQSTLRQSSAVGPLVRLCQTLDQAKTVLSLMRCVGEKALDTTCVVTAARGRGKSAALGLAAAGAIAHGYSNIFCTAPSPENMRTFFDFAARGLSELGYVARREFVVLEGASETEFSHCVIRIDVCRGHRQTIQFVAATDVRYFAQAELAIVDEAAALPLPLVRQMLGPYLVFVSSTVSGYEGTGRSLTLKLVADLRRRANSHEEGGIGIGSSGSGSGSGSAINAESHGNRRLCELCMRDPIRYNPHDPVERWLHTLLCLDATVAEVPLRRAPHPQACALFHVNRDALFSYEPRAEALLQRIQALLVAAHYKNQPNDLQLLADAPGHHVFVLCAAAAPASDDATATHCRDSTGPVLPDVLCVAHVCEEGRIAAERVRGNLTRGIRPAGDLIPYTLSQYFLDDSFAALAGMRVVRIATNPELQRAGYGSRTMALLHEYFGHSITELHVVNRDRLSSASSAAAVSSSSSSSSSTQSDLLIPLHERAAECVDYVGVSFGLTTELFNFWRRAGYSLVYARQAAHDLTGEHSGVMIRPFHFTVDTLARQFRHRFVRLLAMPFRHLATELALSVLVDPEVHNARRLAEAAASDPQASEDDGAAHGDGPAREDQTRSRDSPTSDTRGSDCTRAMGEQPDARWAAPDTMEPASVCIAGTRQATRRDICALFTPGDLRRLQLFTTAFVEGGNVLDLVPAVAQLYFDNRLLRSPDGSEGVLLTHAQAGVLCAVGLQCLTLDELSRQEAFRAVPVAQLRAFYQKALRLIIEHVLKLQRARMLEKGATEEDEKEKEDEDEDGGARLSGPGRRRRGGGGAVDGRESAAEETARAVYDSRGALCGLSVARSLTPRVCADTTLLRDASKASSGQDTEAQRHLQNVFRRPKKMRRRG